MDIQKKLFELEDKEYKAFHSKLVPTIDPNTIIGIRVPVLRSLAKEIKDEEGIDTFLHSLPHAYFDENMLHAILLTQIKDFGECISLIDAFLPYIDNWAVCDILNPKCFKKHREEVLAQIPRWLESKEGYTCRFGIEMLMGHFLDEDFDPKYLEWISKLRSNEYYVNMMIAWYFATALAKQWGDAICYIEKQSLDDWTHNKAIQKAIESCRITPTQKDYLRSLKVKK